MKIQAGRKRGSFPRIRGDVPIARDEIHIIPVFSPHTRGCSYIKQNNIGEGEVFPAYAGMFRRLRPYRFKEDRFPRIRGDVPG